MGTFKNYTKGSSIDDCKSCTPGMYCKILGLDVPTGLCQGGWYCSGRAISKTPTLNGTGWHDLCLFYPFGDVFVIDCVENMYNFYKVILFFTLRKS